MANYVEVKKLDAINKLLHDTLLYERCISNEKHEYVFFRSGYKFVLVSKSRNPDPLFILHLKCVDFLCLKTKKKCILYSITFYWSASRLLEYFLFSFSYSSVILYSVSEFSTSVRYVYLFFNQQEQYTRKEWKQFEICKANDLYCIFIHKYHIGLTLRKNSINHTRE